MLPIVAAAAIVGLVYLLFGGREPRSGRIADRTTTREAGRDSGGAAHGSPETRQPGHGSLEKPREGAAPLSWHIRFVGRDDKPVLPDPVRRVVEGSLELVAVAPIEGVFPIPPKPASIVFRKQAWLIALPETTIRLDRFVPVLLEIRDADSGALITTLPRGHCDTERGSLVGLAAPLALEGRVVLAWRTPLRISRYADSVRGVLPAWRETDIRLRVLGPDAEMVAGAKLEFAYLDGSIVAESSEYGLLFDTDSTVGMISGAKGTSDSSGLLRVRGIPLIDREVVRLGVEKGGRRVIVKLRLRRGRRVSAIARLPGSPSRGSYTGSLITEKAEESGNRYPRAEQGALVVRAFRNDGAVAADAMVRLIGEDDYEARTNAEGVATFKQMVVGRYLLELAEPGILYATARQEIRAGITHAATLTEPRGWAIEVRVVDDRGHAVPSAALDVTPSGGLGYVRILDRVQWIDHLTGRDGSLRVGPLPPGEARITARYGTRSAFVEVHSSQSTVTIRLPEVQ